MSDLVYTLPPEAVLASFADDGVGARITDHATRAVERLGQQYRKPKFEAFLRALIGPLQTVENTAWDVLTLRNVDTAIGVQLDTLGEIVGQPRNGMVDADYRRAIRARIAVNNSNGTIHDVITAAKLVIDNVLVKVVIIPQYPAALTVVASGAAVTTGVADIVIDFLRETVSAGVRILFEYSTVAPSAAFCFAGGPGLGFNEGAFASVLE